MGHNKKILIDNIELAAKSIGMLKSINLSCETKTTENLVNYSIDMTYKYIELCKTLLIHKNQ